MAQAYSRGAVHLWVSSPLSSAVAYLGTAERAPRVSRRRRYSELRNDLGGDTPFDISYQGSEAFVTAKLTRWNETTLLGIENAPIPLIGTDTAGVDPPGAIGTLMMTENVALKLWVQYAYAAGQIAPKGAYANAANGPLRVGYHFVAAFLESPDDHEGGTDPATEAIVFRCIRSYQPDTGAFLLYDRDMSAIAGLLPN